MPKSLIVVDGDLGGGQILRNGFALAALAMQPLRIINVRAAKQPPGLTSRQLQALQMVAQLCSARLRGGRVGSMQLSFSPGKLMDGEMTVDTGSSSSLTLLTQIVLPCLLFAPGPSTWEGIGATDVNFSPTFDELWGVFLPAVTRFGVHVQLELVKRGFHPKGSGRVRLTVDPTAHGKGLLPVVLRDQGKIIRVDGRAYVTDPEEEEFMVNMCEAMKSILANALPGVLVQIQQVVETEESAVGRGRGVTLVAITDVGCRFGASALCDHLMKTPHDYAEEVVKRLANHIRCGACVDEWVQDQVVLYMALAAGRSEIRVGDITEHTRSAIMAAETILPCRFEILPEGLSNILACDGVGLLTPGVFSTALVDRPRATSLNAPHLVPFVPHGQQAPPEPEEASSSSEDEEEVVEVPADLLEPRSPSPEPEDDTPDPNAATFLNPFTGGVMSGPRPPRASRSEKASQVNGNDKEHPFGPKKLPPAVTRGSGSAGMPFGPRSTAHSAPPASSSARPFGDPPPSAAPAPVANPFGSAAPPPAFGGSMPPVAPPYFFDPGVLTPRRRSRSRSPPSRHANGSGGAHERASDAHAFGVPTGGLGGVTADPFGRTSQPMPLAYQGGAPAFGDRHPLDRLADAPADFGAGRKRGRDPEEALDSSRPWDPPRRTTDFRLQSQEPNQGFFF